ncbi:diguanylate cyclase [Wenzhouxiangella limi]|uniref:diguanylate cyclase n=1 Tax=Wenzhouxiangella limi TaxID=2707351 RepID=A0A845VA43_9GAMM|nr:diguanylate cyclase [Wenzhouxiangella limi]NDY96991.1 diguanylate cyclase [Wenzhouxiangella limi]
MTSSARALLESAGDRLPSPSGVALAIMELWEDDRTTVQQLSRLVQADPALSGRLLKLANSAAMGNRAVAAIPEAIVRVGMQTVGQLAVAFSLIDTNSEGECPAFNYDNYWSHCLLMAVLSRGLAHATRLAPPEDLFACGLLARIGILALSTIYPEQYSLLLESNPENLAAAELKQFGIDHNELSEALMLDYRVPQALAEPARYHEDPQQSDFDPQSRPGKLANLLHLAHCLADMALQSGADRSRQGIVNKSLAAKIGLEEESLGAVFNRGLEEWREWSKLLELPVRDTPSYEDEDSELTEATEPEGSERQRRLRAILIDGNPAVARLESRLDELGVSVTICKDQNEALRISMESRPDFYVFPASDHRLCRLIRSTEWGSSVYLICVVAPPDESAVIESFEAGADDVVPADISPPELRARLVPVRRVLSLDRAWRKDRSELRRIARELALAHRHQQVLSLTDHLTNLPNRRAAMQALKQAWCQSQRNDKPIAVIMIDIDHFKQINDKHGHAAGDQVLKTVSSMLKSATREDETMARIGGEEFLLISANSGLRDLIVAAERLRRRLESATINQAGTAIRVTASMGIAEREPAFDDPDMLLNAADKALYEAKSSGRNRLCFYQGGRIRSL